MSLFAAALLAGTTVHADEITSEHKAFFEAKIRPLLIKRCYECHATDAKKIQGGLVLDSRWGWSTGGESGPAIVPGKLDDSLLIDAVRRTENSVSAMPPKTRLPQEEVALLEQWVRIGAPDPRPKVPGGPQPVAALNMEQRRREHWSWRPIASPQPPAVKDASWPRSDLDRFILARIEEAGLRPAAPADKRTWLRRVFFDLVGLPPTPDRIDAFIRDDAPDAFERVVRELLDSPHFGEKWARHWMDLVRYAETCGHEFDYPIPHAFQYRDYLIRAFNADVPYDDFIREHIAGDLLPEPRRHPDNEFNESVIATGFWYFHEATHAPTDVLADEADHMDNQLDVFGKSFLGLTLACARCHDHKFDAVSMHDYYALTGYLHGSCRTEVPIDRGRTLARAVEELRSRRDQSKAALRKVTADRPGPYLLAAAELAKQKQTGDAGAIAAAAKASGLDRAKLESWCQLLGGNAKDVLSPDGFWASWGRNSAVAGQQRNRVRSTRRALADFREATTLMADFSGNELPAGWSASGTGFQPTGEATGFSFQDGRLLARRGTADSALFGRHHAGSLRSPTFEVSHSRIFARVRSENILFRIVPDNYHMAIYNGLLFRGTYRNGGQTNTGGAWKWIALDGNLNKYIGHKAFLEFQDGGGGYVAVDEVRLSRDVGPPAEFHPLIDRLLGGDEPIESAADLAAHLDRVCSQAVANVRDGSADEADGEIVNWLSSVGFVTVADTQLEAGRKLAAGIRTPELVTVMAQGTPENAHVYIRGSHRTLGDEIPNRFLTALGAEEGTRLDLANAVASADNPLTSRVIVNRLWHHLFGRGIVRTVDDFGPQGVRPSHPELLDWLATDFVRNGWSLKEMLRTMVLSQTYRQASVPAADLSAEMLAVADPTNRLLHRMPVRRLQAEAIRDAILTVSGRLDRRQFGPSIATHRTPFMTGRGARGSGPLDGAGRRSVYLSIYRNFLNPFLTVFDMPNPFGPKGRRSVSNVPAQALALLNDPFVTQQAALWAKNGDSAGADVERRIASMVERAHGVEATPEQIATFREFLDGQAAEYGAMDTRAWSDLAHVLLNMKAFYFLQ